MATNYDNIIYYIQRRVYLVKIILFPILFRDVKTASERIKRFAAEYLYSFVTTNTRCSRRALYYI